MEFKAYSSAQNCKFENFAAQKNLLLEGLVQSVCYWKMFVHTINATRALIFFLLNFSFITKQQQKLQLNRSNVLSSKVRQVKSKEILELFVPFLAVGQLSLWRLACNDGIWLQLKDNSWQGANTSYPIGSGAGQGRVVIIHRNIFAWNICDFCFLSGPLLGEVLLGRETGQSIYLSLTTI